MTGQEILDKIDADISRTAKIEGRKTQQIDVNRDRIAALLGQREKWERPDEVYADSEWEICIIWRSRYGRVELGSEPDGRIGYYVKQTFSSRNEEGFFESGTKEELMRVMS